MINVEVEQLKLEKAKAKAQIAPTRDQRAMQIFRGFAEKQREFR